MRGHMLSCARMLVVLSVATSTIAFAASTDLLEQLNDPNWGSAEIDMRSWVTPEEIEELYKSIPVITQIRGTPYSELLPSDIPFESNVPLPPIALHLVNKMTIALNHRIRGKERFWLRPSEIQLRKSDGSITIGPTEKHYDSSAYIITNMNLLGPGTIRYGERGGVKQTKTGFATVLSGTDRSQYIYVNGQASAGSLHAAPLTDARRMTIGAAYKFVKSWDVHKALELDVGEEYWTIKHSEILKRWRKQNKNLSSQACREALESKLPIYSVRRLKDE